MAKYKPQIKLNSLDQLSQFCNVIHVTDKPPAAPAVSNINPQTMQKLKDDYHVLLKNGGLVDFSNIIKLRRLTKKIVDSYAKANKADIKSANMAPALIWYVRAVVLGAPCASELNQLSEALNRRDAVPFITGKMVELIGQYWGRNGLMRNDEVKKYEISTELRELCRNSNGELTDMSVFWGERAKKHKLPAAKENAIKTHTGLVNKLTRDLQTTHGEVNASNRHKPLFRDHGRFGSYPLFQEDY